MAAPPPPQLPPPTVPRHSSSETISPPPTPGDNVSARRRIFEPATAPFPQSPSSLQNVTIAPEPQPHDEIRKETPEEAGASSTTSTSAAPTPSESLEDVSKKKPSSRKCIRLRVFGGHSIEEAGGSAWFDARILLLVRLAITSMLISHLMFFSLRRDFSFRRYATWSYAGLTFAFLVAVMCSLVQVLRIGDEEEDGEDSEPRDVEEGETRTTAVTDSSAGERKDNGLVYLLAQVAVPTYQVFVTAIVFSAVVYWAAIRSSESQGFNYPIIALHIAAPAAALLDVSMSMSMCFRFVYAPLFVLYNAVFGVALWVFYKLDDLYVYQFLDPSVQPKKEFLTKCVGLVIATIVASLVPCTVAIARDLVKGRKWRLAKKKDPVDEASDEDATQSNENSDPPQSPREENEPAEQREERRVDETDKDDTFPPQDPDFDEIIEEAEFVASAAAVSSGGERRGRPLSNRHDFPNSASSRRWRRVSTGLVASISQGSLGSSAGEPRSTAWDLEIDGLQARPEDEFFRMPAAYNASGEEEVVKLVPSGSTGGMSRSESGRTISRSGSATLFGRSGSTRSMARSESGRNVSSVPSGAGLWHSNSRNRIARSTSGSNRFRPRDDRGFPL